MCFIILMGVGVGQFRVMVYYGLDQEVSSKRILAIKFWVGLDIFPDRK